MRNGYQREFYFVSIFGCCIIQQQLTMLGLGVMQSDTFNTRNCWRDYSQLESSKLNIVRNWYFIPLWEHLLHCPTIICHHVVILHEYERLFCIFAILSLVLNIARAFCWIGLSHCKPNCLGPFEDCWLHHLCHGIPFHFYLPFSGNNMD